MKKNLLIVISNIGIGGQERVAINTASILKDKYNSTLSVFYMEENSYKPSIPLVDLDIPPSQGIINKIVNVFRRTRALKKLKRNLNIDVALSFGSTANIANALSRVSDKVIVSIRGYYEALSNSLIGKHINKLVYNKADVTICVAEKLSRDLREIYQLPIGKVVTLYNPYDFDSIVEQANKNIPIEIRHPAIVTMGRLDKIKGYRHLLNAFALVQKIIPEASLIFVGEGSEKDKLKELVTVLGLTENVVFVGFQANPHSYLSKCDIYVLSSIHEGFPNALVEAMACGLPVVATDCKSGPREILTEIYCDIAAKEIEYSDYGILIPPFSSDDSSEVEKEKLLADAMLQLLTSENIYGHYRKKVQERAKVFSFKVYRDKVIKIIEG